MIYERSTRESGLAGGGTAVTGGRFCSDVDAVDQLGFFAAAGEYAGRVSDGRAVRGRAVHCRALRMHEKGLTRYYLVSP
ncbi:MAG: hypothetical protein H0S80_04115 [Desulfovibrionaceae bacterium]|nr:hypothetical protein [Desulfovibrionaceae bacterium]